MTGAKASGLWTPFGLYYGWIMVAGAVVMNLVTSPLSPVTYSFFIVPMGEELGWTRSEMSWALTFRLVAVGVTGPILGQLVDRFGARWMGVIAGVIAGMSLLSISQVDQLWMLYVVYAASGAAGFGGPSGALLTTVPVGKWFIVKRGRAMALATVGGPVGTVLAIQVAQWLIDSVGWRTAWIVFGAILIGTVIPVSALFLRRSPEDHGLLPDGAVVRSSAATTATGPISAVEREVNWTRGEALRHPVTWLILSAAVIQGFGLSGTLVHRVAFWHDLGIPSTMVALGTAMDPFTVIFSGLLFGVVAERVPLRYLGLFAGLGFGASMLPMILSSGQTYTIFLHNIVWGFAAGAFIAVNNLIWPTYFGRKFLGSIQGVVLPITVISNGLAAPAYGYLLDVGIHPTMVWTFSAGLFVLAGCMMFLARPPRAEITTVREPAPAGMG